MTWLRQHWEGIHVVAVAFVSSEPLGYRVQVVEDGGGPEHGSINGSRHYGSRSIAFEAADALVRNRRGGHGCEVSCTEWVETSGASPPPR
jgi:hypothetical protein